MGKYLITGITGFAGPNLAKLLIEKGHTVHGLIRCPNGRQTDILDILTMDEYSSIVFQVGDLKHYYTINKLIDTEQYDGVYHLAAQSHPTTSFRDPILTWEENVTASMNLITAIQENSKQTRLMFCSTSEVYGDTCKDKGILRVGDMLTPSNPYGASKAAIDLYMQERMNNGFIDGFITRAFSHTGPRRGFNFSISSDAYQIAKMIHDKQDNILNIGNLKTQRVVMDVRDCVNAYYLLMMNPNSNKGVYNICGDTVHEMQYYTDLLVHYSGLNDIKQQIYKPFYRDIDIQVQIGDSDDVRNNFGWKQEISIEKTMKDLLTYWIRKLNVE